MKEKPSQQHRDVPWWSMRLTQKELASVGFHDRERSVEAEARHRAYVQNAYATLSSQRELALRGAQAGLQVGATLLAIETALLIAIIAAAVSVNDGTFGTLYGQTPVSGTFFEPLWPILLSLPALPAFAVIGALAALLRRVGSIRRRVLDKYFNPTPPRFDLLTFWLATIALLIASAFAANLFSSAVDPTGLLTLIICASGLLAWPSHKLWLSWYLPLIEKHGSASLATIQAGIQQQL